MVDEEETEDSGAATPTSTVSAESPSAETKPAAQVLSAINLGSCEHIFVQFCQL